MHPGSPFGDISVPYGGRLFRKELTVLPCADRPYCLLLKNNYCKDLSILKAADTVYEGLYDIYWAL